MPPSVKRTDTVSVATVMMVTVVPHVVIFLTETTHVGLGPKKNCPKTADDNSFEVRLCYKQLVQMYEGIVE